MTTKKTAIIRAVITGKDLKIIKTVKPYITKEKTDKSPGKR